MHKSILNSGLSIDEASFDGELPAGSAITAARGDSSAAPDDPALHRSSSATTLYTTAPDDAHRAANWHLPILPAIDTHTPYASESTSSALLSADALASNETYASADLVDQIVNIDRSGLGQTHFLPVALSVGDGQHAALWDALAQPQFKYTIPSMDGIPLPSGNSPAAAELDLPKNQYPAYDLPVFADLAALSVAAYEYGINLTGAVRHAGWSVLGEASANGPMPYSYYYFDTLLRQDIHKVSYTDVQSHAFGAVRSTEAGHKELAISFTGTEGGADWETDFSTLGFTESYLSVRESVYQWLLAAAKHQGEFDRVLITGHSLGGAMAQACVLDIVAPESTSVWFSPSANQMQTGMLEAGNRLQDLHSELPDNQRLTGSDIDWLRSHLTVATFGAPSLALDSLNSVTSGRLTISSLIDIPAIRNYFFQFEHTSDYGPDDPVAWGLGNGDEVGTRIDIDLDYTHDSLYRFGYSANPSYAVLHSGDLYYESLLRALTGSYLTYSAPGSFNSAFLPQSSHGTDGKHDTIINTPTSEGFGGNDTLIATSTVVSSMDGGTGDDSYVLGDYNNVSLSVQINGPAGEHIDDLYFAVVGMASFEIDSNSNALIVHFRNASTGIESTATVSQWFSNSANYQLNSIRVAYSGDWLDKSSNPWTYLAAWTAGDTDSDIPLLNIGTEADDKIIGDYLLGDTMTGGAGKDDMNGRGGIDNAKGEAGDDRLATYDGSFDATSQDILDGGADSDTYIVDVPKGQRQRSGFVRVG
ncbi:MAG: hypothetical protein IPG91_01480 [Ideonella sp.]|nr:hypothetical protein [Ideonella sp.]